MDLVEESLALQADETSADDIQAQLYNFMPDLVLVSSAPLMRDPAIALPRRLQVHDKKICIYRYIYVYTRIHVYS